MRGASNNGQKTLPVKFRVSYRWTSRIFLTEVSMADYTDKYVLIVLNHNGTVREIRSFNLMAEIMHEKSEMRRKHCEEERGEPHMGMLSDHLHFFRFLY